MSNTVFIQTDKKKRLALDVIGQLEEDLEQDPLDYGKWNRLIKSVVAKDKEEQVRSVYDKYLSIFKFDGNQWCNYINYELSRDELEKVETLFQRCFSITDSVELCRLYVAYVRRVKDVRIGGEKARGTIIQAFEFAIDKVGLDLSSGKLWNDYIEFLKDWTPSATWEQQQKVDLIRKVYKKYLVIPTDTLEAGWAQYTKWENEVNSVTATKFISEKSAEFMLARSWLTEFHNVTEASLERNIHSGTIRGPESREIEKQLEYWLKWVDLEKKNILELKDNSQVEKRVAYVYKQATFSLPFISELWFKYSKFLLISNEEANLSKCITLLTEGLNLNPRSLILTFQLDELHEKENSFDSSKEAFNKLIDHLVNDHKKITDQIDLITGLTASNGNINGKNINTNNDVVMEDDATPTPGPGGDDDDDDDDVNNLASLRPELSEGDKAKLIELGKLKEELESSITLAYVKFMIAYKRSGGIEGARKVFKQGKKFKNIGYQFYVENALLEHYVDHKKIAVKVLDVAMKKYGTNGPFLLAYLNYLINTNDVDNIRILIQTADTNFSKEIASLNEELQNPDLSQFKKDSITQQVEKKKRYLRKLLKSYISYATNYLSLDVAQSFANKYEQTFPSDDPIELFTDRYKLGKYDLIRRFELNSAPDEEDDDDEIQPLKKKRRASKTSEESFSIPDGDSGSHRNSIFNNGALPGQKEEKSFVGPTIVTLLEVLPNASYFGPASQSVFKSDKLVKLFANLPNID
ncbi:uncharacterized protein RJT21DRAFT_123605 [Scheffersomyces amazonensis]|uniref:uncharacterized protein n=1 Tax=Scheffersomyces amazonensis TaxID=1078765 RepID=UPI00315CEF74